MSTVYLLTAVICGIYSCDHRYAIYNTQAQCDVALAEWNNHAPFWPFVGAHNGSCSERQLSKEDIAVYLSRPMN